MQLLKALPADTEHDFCSVCCGIHCFVVSGVRAYQDHIFTGAQRERFFCKVRIGAGKDQIAVQRGCLFHKVQEAIVFAICRFDKDEFAVHTLADPVVIHSRDLCEDIVVFRVVECGGNLHRIQRLADEGLLVALEYGLAAKRMLTDLDRLHRGRGRFGELVLDFIGDEGTFLQRKRALCNLHREGHTGRNTALFTVGFGGQLENVKSF